MKRYTNIADIDANRYVGVEIEALTGDPSHSDDGGSPGILTSAEDGLIAMYSIFLRSGPDVTERIGDFATSIEAIEYAESIMALQLSHGLHWTRGGRIFDLFCVSAYPDDARFLGRESKRGALQWVADPAEAMVFNRCPGQGLRPEVFLPDGRFRKHPWLAAQARYARHRRVEEPSATRVFIKTVPELRFGPSFAEVRADKEFALRLLRLQRLCISQRLSEVRVDAAPMRWGPGDAHVDLGLSREQLIVTRAAFQFSAQPVGGCASVKTYPQNIVSFLRAARAHPPDGGVLVMEEDDRDGDSARSADWKDWPA